MAYGFREGNPLLSIIGAFRQEALDRDRMRENTRRWEEEQSNQKVQRMMDNNHRNRMFELTEKSTIASVNASNAATALNKQKREHGEADFEQKKKDRKRKELAIDNLKNENANNITSYKDGLSQIQEQLANFNFGANSGDGAKIEQNENGDFTVKVPTENGDENLTAVPKDQSSPPMVIKKENADSTAQHVQNAIQFARQEKLSPEESKAYVRAALYTDPETGDTRPATPEEHATNMKNQGFLTVNGEIQRIDKKPKTPSRLINRSYYGLPENADSKAPNLDSGGMWGKNAPTTGYENRLPKAPKPAVMGKKGAQSAVKITENTSVEEVKNEADKGTLAKNPWIKRYAKLSADRKAFEKKLAGAKTRKQRLELGAVDYASGTMTADEYTNYVDTGSKELTKGEMERDIIKDEADVKLTNAKTEYYNNEALKATAEYNAALNGTAEDKAKAVKIYQDSLTKSTTSVLHGLYEQYGSGDRKDWVKSIEGKLAIPALSLVTGKGLDTFERNKPAFLINALTATELAVKSGQPEKFVMFFNSAKTGSRQAVGERLANIMVKANQSGAKVSEFEVVDMWNDIEKQMRKAMNGELDDDDYELINQTVEARIGNAK